MYICRMDRKKIIAAGIVIFSVLLATFSFYGYQIVYAPNILVEQSPRYLYIPSNATFRSVQDSLYKGRFVDDPVSFSFLAKVMKYQENVKPGRYFLEANMTNRQAINVLRAGNQTPTTVTFSSVRMLDEVAPRLAATIEPSTLQISNLLQDSALAQQYGFTPQNFVSMFLPNTYEVYWNITAEALLERLHKEYQRFWNEERRAKADSLGLNPVEVSILASIVKAETNQMDEASKIAGVYYNRLKRGEILAADPTLVFAHGDFTIRRVLNVHKQIESPYNTYKNRGLPPGPINMPEIAYIEAVLNTENHKYMYFCADAEAPGYHAFAITAAQHNRNARKYQAYLNKRKIFK